MGSVNVAIIGVGNCASSLVQGVHYYREAREDDFVPGLMHVNLGGYHISDINFVAAFDIDKNKVGKDLSKAIYTLPNNTYKFCDVPKTGVKVERGMTHDGLGKYLSQIIEKAPGPTADIVNILKETKTDVVINYLPVGSEEATKWYVEQVLAAGCGLVNCIPVFIGREAYWQKRFAEKGLPVIGDDIKSQVGELKTNAVVIVATVRALKYHGGMKLSELGNENLDALSKGFENLDKHIENMHYYGFRPVVAVNRFSSDTDAEIELLTKYCEEHNVRVAVNTAWAEGGKGAVELAKAVIEAADSCTDCFTPLYDMSWSIEKKIETIASLMYGARNVEYTLEAKDQMKKIGELGLDDLAVCIAKTQKSLSDDQTLRNRPRDFTVRIRRVELSSGAGFVVPIAGAIMRMPGLPGTPSAEKIDIDSNGQISGLF